MTRPAFLLAPALLVVLSVLIALAIGATLLATEGEAPATEGLPPLFKPETGFANETSNCPTAERATRDAEAEAIVSLLAASRSAIEAIDRDAELRSLTVGPGGTLHFTLFADGSRNAVNVQVTRAFDEGATGRLIVSSHELLSQPPASAPTLDLMALSMGPAAVGRRVSEEHGSLVEQIPLLNLFHEGCHLVWGVIARASSGETLYARISNTTGELRWSPAPSPLGR